MSAVLGASTSERLAKASGRPLIWRVCTGIYWAVVVFGFVVLLAPTVIVVVMSVNDGRNLGFPPQGLSLRWYQRFFENPLYLDTLWVSVRVAFASMLGALVLGTSAAYAIDRFRFVGRGLIESFLLSPMMVPQLVLGLALLQVVAALDLPRNLLLIIIAHILVTTPYVIRTMLASLAVFDRALEEAAMSLGAAPLTVLRVITMPVLQPAFVAAGVFAWVLSFGNVVVSLFLAGRGTLPLPVFLFTSADGQLEYTVTAAAALIIFITTGAILIIERVTGLQKIPV